MKKILFLLVLIFSFLEAGSFKRIDFRAYYPVNKFSCTIDISPGIGNGAYCNSNSFDGIHYISCPTSTGTLQYSCVTRPVELNEGEVPACTTIFTDNGIVTCGSDGFEHYVPNPDPNSNSPTCSEGFIKDGQYYNCNPNTNEAELVPNSDGYEQDEDGNTYPKCNDGFEGSTSISIVAGGTNYNSQSCVQVAPDTDGEAETENPTTPIPTITTGADGSKSWDAPDGNSYHLTPNGTLTTYYPDGSSSVKQVGGDYVAGSGGSGGGVSGETGGGSGGGTAGTGTDGNTNNENNVSTPDTPYTPNPASTSCSDSNLTLQEKMLCELNQGMKNQNAESDPTNSLNNLLKELNKDSNTNATALNTNIKDSNALLTSSKALQENQLKELKDINTNLKNLKTTGGTTTGTTTNPVAEVDSGTASGYINGLDDYINDDTNFQEVKEATSDVTGFLGDKFSQYSDSLKTQLLGLFSSFFSINTTGLPAIGVPYNFNLFGRNFQGAFLDEEMFNRLGLDKLSIIVIFLFSMSGFLHAFRFLISSSSPVQTKDK